MNCAWDPPTSHHCITEYVVMNNGLMINQTQETAITIPDSQISMHNNFSVFGKNILGHNGLNSGPFVLIKSGMLNFHSQEVPFLMFLAPQYKNVSHAFRYNNSSVTLIVYWAVCMNL